MGMLATVINALALQDALEKRGVPTRVQTAIDIREVAEPFIRRRAIRHLEKGRAVIFAAGTGNPFFTTDSAAALRANEIHAEVLLKATKVDGLYTADPQTRPATPSCSPEVTYQEVLEKDLKVMDAAAISLCRDNGMPIAIFNLTQPGNIRRVVCGERVGSIVRRSAASTASAAGRRKIWRRRGGDHERGVHGGRDAHEARRGPLPPRAQAPAHRPRLAGAARRHHRRLLRHADAAQPGRQPLGGRRHDDRRPALRPDARSRRSSGRSASRTSGSTPRTTAR